MTIEQASNFFVGSILTMLGFIVVVAGIIAINNLIARYWRPIKLFTPDSWTGFNPPYHKQMAQVNEDTKQSSSTEVQRA